MTCDESGGRSLSSSMSISSSSSTPKFRVELLYRSCSCCLRRLGWIGTEAPPAPNVRGCDRAAGWAGRLPSFWPPEPHEANDEGCSLPLPLTGEHWPPRRVWLQSPTRKSTSCNVLVSERNDISRVRNLPDEGSPQISGAAHTTGH